MAKLTMNERAAQIMEHLVRHNSHGYSQVSRWGIGKHETITLSDGSKVTLSLGDRDCSSAVIDAWKGAGLKLKGATYTGNMRQAFLATGLFKWHPGTSYSAKRGDIYLNERDHTAMCTHPYGSKHGDILAEFSISEKGTIDGVEGDQTGWESHERTYYNYPWNGILEYIGNEPKPKPKPEYKTPDIYYSLKLKGGSWLSTVKNYGLGENGFAGYPCKAHNGFKAKASRGSIQYRVANERGQWTRWHKDGDPVCIKGNICRIQLKHSECNVLYRVQTTVRSGWLGWCLNDTGGKGYDDWAGLHGEPIDRLQIKLTNRK